MYPGNLHTPFVLLLVRKVYRIDFAFGQTLWLESLCICESSVDSFNRRGVHGLASRSCSDLFYVPNRFRYVCSFLHPTTSTHPAAFQHCRLIACARRFENLQFDKCIRSLK